MTANKVPSDPSRDALRGAIADRAAAKDAWAHATAAERAGIELLAAAEKELEAFGDLDDVIVQHRAKRIKDAAKGGPAADLKLPAELVERRVARTEALEHVVANKVAHASLVRELEAAQKALQRAEHRVSEAAGAILREEAIEQAAALRAAWADVWRLADALNALRSVPLSLPPDAVHFLELVAAFDHRQFPGNFNSALKRAGERWRLWHKSLCDDPDAPKPELSDDDASSAVVGRVA